MAGGPARRLKSGSTIDKVSEEYGSRKKRGGERGGIGMGTEKRPSG